jgi:hypothetical protein
MTITLQLSPQIEEVLVSRAREQGMTVDAYVRSVIENSAVGSQMLAMSPADFEAALDELSENAEDLPILSSEACTRRGIYGEG